MDSVELAAKRAASGWPSTMNLDSLPRIDQEEVAGRLQPVDVEVAHAQLVHDGDAVFRRGDDKRGLPGDEAFAQELGDHPAERLAVFVEAHRVKMTNGGDDDFGLSHECLTERL